MNSRYKGNTNNNSLVRDFVGQQCHEAEKANLEPKADLLDPTHWTICQFQSNYMGCCYPDYEREDRNEVPPDASEIPRASSKPE